jgi:23S rRNA (pseudouridine1915-N3)-methyltransferase
MKNCLLTVGKPKAEYVALGLAEYQKRLKKNGGCELAQVKAVKAGKGKSDQDVMAGEASNLLARLDPRDHVWTLDRKGHAWSSEEWALNLDKARLSGPRRLVLVIGGALGLDRLILERANKKVSLGPVTLPHELAALVTLEQLYRAYSILANTPYHKA